MFSSNASQVSNDALYVEDVFSTYVYSGNDSTQSIVNNIDLATKGGLTWIKGRTYSYGHALFDTNRGAGKYLVSNNGNSEQTTYTDNLTSFNTNGFSLGANIQQNVNHTGQNYVSWSFRKQKKFFDVVTYTGDGVSNRAIAHNLSSVPGCVIVKTVSGGSAGWRVYHRGLPSPTTQALYLDEIVGTQSIPYFPIAPTTTNFYVNGAGYAVNNSGVDYVAYVFAHDAGGFGLTGTDNVISCGSFTTNGSGNATVNLGYEPQWFLGKSSSTPQDWFVVDSMRGWVNGGANDNDALLRPNLSNAEFVTNFGEPTATGFNLTGFTASQTYIYIAIRRGPMKVPTDATKVFSPATRSGNDTATTVNLGFSPDLLLANSRTGGYYPGWTYDRLRGGSYLLTPTNNPEASDPSTDVKLFGQQNGYLLSTSNPNRSAASAGYVDYRFQRAPGFMDVVCYTGTGAGSPQAITHNLTVVPELIFIKGRTNAYSWPTYSKTTTPNELNIDQNFAAYGAGAFSSASPTSTQFTVASNAANQTSATYIAYLFATCAGVSKVGSYTGTGTTQQINCGFTAGSRFVMIKRTDSTGDWYVWDTARGIVSGNDPYLLLNSTAAETTTTDYIDTYAAGFELSSTAPAAINASGGTYIFLAIA